MWAFLIGTSARYARTARLAKWKITEIVKTIWYNGVAEQCTMNKWNQKRSNQMVEQGEPELADLQTQRNALWAQMQAMSARINYLKGRLRYHGNKIKLNAVEKNKGMESVSIV